MQKRTGRDPILKGTIAVLLTSAAASAAITKDNVLVIYNSQNADSLAVQMHYLTVHPGTPTLDLNDATLTPGNIGYADFETKVRNKVRNYLTVNGNASQITTLTLTKGLPHRINDTGASPALGDSPGSVTTGLLGGTLTYSSVDSELMYLWNDLRAGEAGGSMDSKADNLINNPYYHATTSITTFNRAGISAGATLTRNDIPASPSAIPAWRDNSVGAAGKIYLTARLDGHTVAQVNAMVDRAQSINLNPLTDRLIFDENAAGTLDGSDYGNTNTLFSGWLAKTYNNTSTFVVGSNGTVPAANREIISGPVALLASYGGNHDGSVPSNYETTFQGQLVNGAIFNTIESYNGKSLGGLGGFSNQGQVADWIAAGGTLALGNVWEPFAFTLPENQYLLYNFYANPNNLSWVESAWSSIPFVSWQQIVIGDPLANASFVPEPAAVSAMFAIGAMLTLRRRRA